jgi:outer membrane translocation and assembly module TamA
VRKSPWRACWGRSSPRAQFSNIDISGAPTVDTLVAQHLIKTISAAKLTGAHCIISGIRPQIAQTIVQLDLDLTVTFQGDDGRCLAVGVAPYRQGRHGSGLIVRTSTSGRINAKAGLALRQTT